jgi:hypothetical protein
MVHRAQTSGFYEVVANLLGGPGSRGAPPSGLVTDLTAKEADLRAAFERFRPSISNRWGTGDEALPCL